MVYKKNWSGGKRRPYYKRHMHNVPPHVECIQDQIQTLEIELAQLEAADYGSGSLANPPPLDIVKKKASLETLQETLKRFQEEPWRGKATAYNNAPARRERDKYEAIIMKILQFFYFVRLGQYNLFSIVPGPPELCNDPSKNLEEAFRCFCDQIIGAAVHEAIPSVPRGIREDKRDYLFDLLRKFETHSTDRVLPDRHHEDTSQINTVTFNDIHSYMQHIWDNIVHEKTLRGESAEERSTKWQKLPLDDTPNAETNNTGDRPSKPWAVLQFDNMMEAPANNKVGLENNSSKIPHTDTVNPTLNVSSYKSKESIEPQHSSGSRPTSTTSNPPLTAHADKTTAAESSTITVDPGKIDTKEQLVGKLEMEDKGTRTTKLTEDSTKHEKGPEPVEETASDTDGWGQPPTGEVENWSNQEEWTWQEFDQKTRHKTPRKGGKSENKESYKETSNRWGSFVSETVKQFGDEHSGPSSACSTSSVG